MKNVQKIVDAFGGLEALPDNPILLVVGRYLPLAVEWIGTGPRGGMLVSVMHTYEQNGDRMRDPDVVAEVMADGRWLPVSYRQDSLGVFHEVIDYRGGELVVDERGSRSLAEFMVLFDGNLGDQGFVAAALQQAEPFTAK